MATVEIRCTDELIAKHCQQALGEEFQRWYDRAKSVGGREMARNKMHARLRREAAIQEWYAYDIDAEGNRKPMFADGVPVLLIPEVVIHE
jgi:hypothetical protein